MILTLTTACDATLDAILRTPALVHQLWDPNDEAARAYEAWRPIKWWDWLLGARRPPRPSERCRIKLVLGPCDAIRLDLGKSWAGIHFLLTGTEWEGSMPEAFLLRGGTVLEGEDVGYGPARLFRPAEVARIAQGLEGIPPEVLATRYDAKRMLELDIYPGTWDRPQEEELGCLIESYNELRSFASMARDKQVGLVIDLG